MLLRVFVGKRTATSNTSDLSEAVIERLVDETVEMAKLTSEDDSGGLPDAIIVSDKLSGSRSARSAVGKASPKHTNRSGHSDGVSALNADQSIVNSEGGSFDYSRARTVVGNTDGFVGEYEGTGGGLVAAPVPSPVTACSATTGCPSSRHVSGLESRKRRAKAAIGCYAALELAKFPTCEVPVVFDPITARSLVGHIFQAVCRRRHLSRARRFWSMKSVNLWLRPRVTIVDDATAPRRIWVQAVRR